MSFWKDLMKMVTLSKLMTSDSKSKGEKSDAFHSSTMEINKIFLNGIHLLLKF
jgi:hypothetical protein